MQDDGLGATKWHLPSPDLVASHLAAQASSPKNHQESNVPPGPSRIIKMVPKVPQSEHDWAWGPPFGSNMSSKMNLKSATIKLT